MALYTGFCLHVSLKNKAAPFTRKQIPTGKTKEALNRK